MANRFLSNIRINDAYTLPASDGTTGQVIVTDGSGNLSFSDQSGGDSSAASVIYRDSFTGDGIETQFVMQNNVTTEDQTQIYIDGVYQEKDTYSVTGNVITFSAAPELNHSIEVITISGITIGPTTIYQDNFTGDGATTDFTLEHTVSDEVKTMVFLNGVYQFKGTYSVSGTTLSFDAAPSDTVDIEVITIHSAYGEQEARRILFYGKASGAISKGDAVMFAGAQGDHFLFAKATQAAIEANHELFIGLANQDFTNNEYGYVVEFGRIDQIDTTVYTSTAGATLWFDSTGTVAGAITETEPAAPAAKIQVAAVIRLHQNEGSLFVRPTWYHELGELHDVSISSPSDKDLLTYNNTTGVWENSKTLGDITTGNITTSGTVDGVDISDLKSSYDSHNHDDRYYTETEVDTLLTNSTNWDTAYSWGDHASEGYLTSFTETDPIYTASSWYTTTNNASNWDTAYSWGDHSSAGYLTSFTETDPVFSASAASGITSTNINNWNTAYSWGDHASAGYLTSFTETDPTVPSHVKSITTTNINNWNTAYGWGNHASAGYLTSLPSHTHDYVPERGRTDWNDGTVIDDVVGQLAWKHYGNGHTIFDASNSTSPGGTSISNTNPANGWVATYPTLMGWNGTSTYGLRVDSSRLADYAGAPTSPDFIASGSLRAPIFYDSGNTGYYVDPASTSNLNAATFAGDITVNGNQVITAGADADVKFSVWAGSTYGIGMVNSVTLGGLNDYAMTFCMNNDTDRGFWWGYSGQAKSAGAMSLTTAGHLTVTSRVDSPIFYDSDNTGYYVNPASTTYLNAVGAAARFYTGYDAGAANSMSCSNWFRSSGATGWYNGSYGGGIYMTDSTWVRVYNDKQFYVSSTSSEAIATAGDVVALYSDMRLKTKVGDIENAIDKVLKLSGFYYKENEKAKELGYNNDDVQIGVSAQEVKEVVPEAIRRAPVDVETLEDGTQVSKTGENYLTVKYERLVPLLIEAIKEQQKQIDELKKMNK
jgi:hypothetical protein